MVKNITEYCFSQCQEDITTMSVTVSDNIKRQTANTVLARLGEEMIEVVKYHLRRSYAISLAPNDDSAFSLDQLHFGLAVMLGEGSANNILKQITEELNELGKAQVQ
jgi:hypothetical protein